MGKTKQRKFIERNPYHVWVYRDDGSKFVGHFKNKRDAQDWARRGRSDLGKTTTASVSQPLRKRKQQPSLFGNVPPLFGIPKSRSKSRYKNPFGF